ncbi:efflux transporter outer membrane subunit [Rheinheimera sp.]|uniref:efflux transporter outer membrane subunit n=1 Tax=Rheinheimera sp. TaxID=1869214 RepID=UPI00307FC8FF
MNNPSFLLSALSLLVLSACSLAPDTPAQLAETPASYPQDATASVDQKASTLHWAEFFNQPQLQQLMKQALEQNKDLRLAALNVERVRAQYQIADSAHYPGLDLSGSGTRQRLPGDLTGTGQAAVSSQYGLNVGVTAYELDLFGKVRNQSEQALQQFYASEQNRTSAQISLLSELAANWYSYAANQQLLELATHTLHSQQKTLELTEKRVELGAASELTLQQVRGTVANAAVEQSRYQRLLQQTKNALDVLAGGPVDPELLPKQPLSKLLTLPDLPAGAPSDLLAQRPDLKAAEHQLKAANANIGVAKAAYFPSISLTATAGTASAELGGLFESGSGAWSFVPQVSMPIFNWGRTQANVSIAETDGKIALETYQQKVQQAFREVADALADQAGYRRQLEALQQLSQSSERAFTLANARHQQGTDSYLEVLDAQRNWYSAQQQFISGQQARLQGQLTLYKVLGGGWQPNPAP